MNVRRADWESDAAAIREIRTIVFVDEQGVPPEREIDGLDARCMHVLALDVAGMPIGTARLLPDGHIGRMAVLKHRRGAGVGSAMLRELSRVAIDRGLHPAVNAQVSAVEFYARHGFERVGEPFMDAGIEHVHMVLTGR